MRVQKIFFVSLTLFFSHSPWSEPMSVQDELEQILTCQYYPADKYGDAATLIDQLRKEGTVEPVKRMPRYHFRVVGDLALLGLTPLYIGHTHGDFIGTFARFSEDIETLVNKIKAKGIKLRRHDSESNTAYLGEQEKYWQLIVMTVPKKYAGRGNPSVPFSDKDTTLVQCVYQGP